MVGGQSLQNTSLSGKDGLDGRERLPARMESGWLGKGSSLCAWELEKKTLNEL